MLPRNFCETPGLWSQSLPSPGVTIAVGLLAKPPFSRSDYRGWTGRKASFPKK